VGALVELGYESMDSGVVKGLSWLRLGTFLSHVSRSETCYLL
jgi:hypothetical protein